MFQTSGGLGTMGYSLPAPSARSARGQGSVGHRRRRLLPDEPPGAGGLTQERIPVKIAVVNNGYLGMVRSGSSCSGLATTSTSISRGRRTTSSWRMRTASRAGASPPGDVKSAIDAAGASRWPDRVPGVPRGERLPDGAVRAALSEVIPDTPYVPAAVPTPVPAAAAASAAPTPVHAQGGSR